MGLKEEELKKILEKIFKKDISSIEELIFDDKEGITGKVEQKSLVLHKYRLIFKDGSSTELLVKSKSKNIIKNGIKLLNHDKDLYLLYLLARYHKVLSFDNNYIRELKFYENMDKDLTKYSIPSYGCYKNSLKSRYLIFMKEITGSLDFDKSYIFKALDTIIKFHKKYYAGEDICSRYRLNRYTSLDYKRARKLFSYIFDKFDKENRMYFSENEIKKIKDFIENIHVYHAKFIKHGTLTHNDFTPRNIFFFEKDIIIYDWELACYQNPEHDLIEFLIFVLNKYDDKEVRDIVSYYKDKLFRELNTVVTDKDYKEILQFNVLEFIVNKLSVYRLADKSLKFDFMKQMCENSARILRITKEEI